MTKQRHVDTGPHEHSRTATKRLRPGQLLGARERGALTREFGQRLRSLRLRADPSEDVLPLRCGVSRSTIEQAELGAKEPCLSPIFMLAGGLRVSAAVLGDPPSPIEITR
jgi:DNA-binding XRE family transcriptional regulator